MEKVIKLKKEVDMCTRPLFGKIVKFAVPLVITGILQLLYNAADIIVVGKFDSDAAMAAVGSTGSLVNLIVNLLVGLSVGSLSAMAQALGANLKEEAEKILHTSMLISVLGGVIVGIVGFFLSEQLLIWMKTPSDVLYLSAKYLKIFFLGMPFSSIYNFGSSIMRASGDTKRPLYVLMLSGIVNVILNLFFVIVLKMSVEGVAFATVASQAVSAIFILLYLANSKNEIKLSFKKLKIYKYALIKIIKIGLPAGIQSTIFSVSNVIIQSTINSMGMLAMAGNSAASNIEGFIYISMNSVAQSCLTFTGQNFGARKKENCKLVMMQATIITTLLGLVMGIGAYLIGDVLLNLYNTNPIVISFGLDRLAIIGCTYFLCGIMEVLVGTLRGMDRSLIPMLVSIVGVCGLRLFWIYTIYRANPNPTMLYLSYPISWAFTCIIHYICILYVKRTAFKRKVSQEPEKPIPNAAF